MSQALWFDLIVGAIAMVAGPVTYYRGDARWGLGVSALGLVAAGLALALISGAANPAPAQPTFTHSSVIITGVETI